MARGWVADINSIIRSSAVERPSRVLVLVNPKGGARKAAKVWNKKAQPILQLAGVLLCSPWGPLRCCRVWLDLRRSCYY